MAILKLLKAFERSLLRPIFHILYPKRSRSRVIKIKMKIKLFFFPIKYQLHKGNVEIGNRLCIFVSYQPKGILPTTWKYLQHLKENLGYSVVLISNCPLQKNDIPALQNICLEVIERDNIGYDFGAYKDGILRYMEKLGSKFDELETLLIANDSVIGPIYDMSPMHAQMQAEDCDFWGMNEGHVPNEHINTQHICSYFIVFKNNIIKTNIFKKFWKDMAYVSNKYYAIYYEKTLTPHFVTNEFKYSVYIKKEKIIEYLAKNPDCDDILLTAHLPQILIHNLGKHERYLRYDMMSTNETCPMLTLVHMGMPLMKRCWIERGILNLHVFKAILNMHEKQLTGIITKEEILDEMGLNPRTKNSIFRWKKYII